MDCGCCRSRRVDLGNDITRGDKMRALERLIAALEQPRIRQLLDEAERKERAWNDAVSLRALSELEVARREAKTALYWAPLPTPPKEERSDYQTMIAVEWIRFGLNKSAAKVYMEIWAETDLTIYSPTNKTKTI
jgi:hypothetical protein